MRKSYQFEPLFQVVNCSDFMKNYLANYTREELFRFGHIREERQVLVASHLEPFATWQLEHWIESLFQAYNFKEKVNYIISVPDKDSDKKNYPVVATVDYKNTGVITHNLHWSDGLQQYLQMKHALTLSPENLVSVFMSYYGFFNKYHGNIYGLSGTLGTAAHYEFLRETYGVELNTIPTFMRKDLTEFTPIIADNKGEWQQEIMGAIYRKIVGKRAVLIIMETMVEVLELYERLKEGVGHNVSHIFTYGLGAKDEEKIFIQELEPGDMVIATNLAGRGTDLKINSEVIKNGGLHVIMTLFSPSVRVEEQAYGRSAREGEPGSAQLILNKEKLNSDCQGIACLKLERAKNEKLKLQDDKLNTLPTIKAEDEVFSWYIELIREVDSPTGYNLLLGRPKNNETKPFSLYLYAENKKIILKMVGEKESKDLDLTEKVTTIDPVMGKRLEIILSDSRNTVSNLSKQEYETCHFIAAQNGYTKDPEPYKRVLYDLAEILKGREKWTARTRWHLVNGDSFATIFVEKIELRRLFLLWLVDRRLYHHEYEIMQIAEDWGIWFRQHLEMFHQWGVDQLRELLKKEFSIFKAGIIERINNGTLIQNQAYLVRKAGHQVLLSSVSVRLVEKGNSNLLGIVKQDSDHLGPAIDILDKAIRLDQEHSWVAHNTLSRVILLKDGGIGNYEKDQVRKGQEVKQKCYEHLHLALKNINEIIIPEFAAQLSFLFSDKLINYDDDLAIQLAGSIATFKQIAALINKNMDIIVTSSNKEMIKTKRLVNLEELTQDINISSVMSQVVSGDLPPTNKNLTFTNKKMVIDLIRLSGGESLYELETYKLREDKNWFGTAFAVAIGIVSIFTGSWMISAFVGNMFAAAFGSSLVMQGIGDIISSLIALKSGNPIDFRGYINSKGMALGITLVTSGILSFLDTLPAIHSLGLAKKIGEVSSNVGKMVAIQATTAALSAALYDVGRKTIDTDSILAEAKRAIDKVISSCKVTLGKIFATDKFNSNNELEGVLYDQVDKIVDSYRSRFQDDDKMVFGKGVVASTVNQFFQMGKFVSVGMELVTNGIKNQELIDDIAKATENVINEIGRRVLASGVMMKKKLTDTFGENISGKLILAMENNGYMSKTKEIDYKECNKLNAIELNQDLSGYKKGMIEACEYVNKLLSQEYDYSGLGARFTRLAVELKGSMQKTMVHEVVDIPSGYVGEKLEVVFITIFRRK